MVNADLPVAIPQEQPAGGGEQRQPASGVGSVAGRIMLCRPAIQGTWA
ncbi:hypothetical protein METH_02650 [Leisingera methylohalidivorans DSM 14336]|uniref:Uncharacterized protein n=1 Tax=Leisingera methylohalidivorans DSM 14336 TaxID=999552 RepID=V9W105_9RHOB|nr:hypothetical protein METH_02650 [Leisingera methylohalidivorans DSM 14336]